MHVTVGPASNWRWTLIAAAISIVVIVAAETLVSKFSSREAKLTYTAPESLPFSGDGKKVGIYQLEITNEGDSVAEGLTGLVRIPGAAVDNQRVSGPGALTIEAKAEGDTVRLSAASLNPGETIHVSILASSSAVLPKEPEASVRANGVSGVRLVPGVSRTTSFSFLPTLLIASAAVILMLLLQFVFRKRKDGAVVTSGWSNVANVFWLGHDLLWTRNAAGSSPRERILHGLKQCRHHAGQAGLTDTDAYRAMDSLDLAVRQMTDAALNPQSREGIVSRVNELLAAFSQLAVAQQPSFEPIPR
jgi:hypothetical protein